MRHCLDDDTLSAFIDGTLSEAEIESVDAHLDRCADCRSLFSELARSTDVPVVADESAVDLPGPARRAGRYVLGAVLGEGGMGVVHEAYDPHLRRKVAIKLLRPDARMLEADEDQLVAEARALARLSHPNVVQVYDAGIHDQQVFLCMEHVEGRTMRRWLADGAPSWRDVVRAFAAAGRGLAAAHAAGIVHRDFKPENVLLAADGRVLVTDFGLARETETAARVHSLAGAATPRSITLAGTPAYMAPEQLEGGHVDARSDQFSFCVALAEALCRESPAIAVTGDADRRAESLIARLRAHRLPAQLIQAVERGLEHDPGRRFLSMEPLLAKLARAMQRRHTASLAGALALVAVLVVNVMSASSQQASDQTSFCGPDDPLSAVLTADARGAMRASLVRTAVGGQDAWQRVDRRLAAVAQQWRSARVEVCREPAPADAPRREARRLEEQCLEDSLHELRSFVALLRDADAATSANAVELSLQVGTPRRCRRELPLDPGARPSYDHLQRELVELELLVGAGHWAEGLARARAGLAAVKALRMTGLEAEWLFVRADLERGSSDLASAEASFLESLQAADRAGRDDLRVRCMAGLAAIQLVRDRADEAQRWSAQADAAMERGDRDPASEAVLRNLQAYIELQQGRPEKARELALRALTLWQQANHHHVAVGHHTIAISLNELGRMDEALSHEREALRLWERDLGPQHPNTGTALLGVGNSEHRRGQSRAAIADFERALAIFERTGTRGGVTHTLLSLALAHHRVDQPKRSREMAERCLLVGIESLGPQSSVTIGCRIVLGKLDLADGAVARAVAVFTEARASVPPDLKERDGRAVLADASFGLARALWQRAAPRDRARALELAHEAEMIYGEIKAIDDDRDEAARWIAARRTTVPR